MPKKNYNKPEASKKQLEQELLEVSEALWDANVRLAAEEKARTELLSNLSHDLRTIFLSTKGCEDSEVPEGLRKFLRYVAADAASSTEDFDDDYVRSLQKSVSRIKSDRKMGERYMLLKELLSDERNEGRIEGITIGIVRGRAISIIELLSEIGEVSLELSDVIMAEKDPESLLAYLKAASKAESVEKFREETGL